MIQKTAPAEGEVTVVEMRYFVGPESPPSIKAEILSVSRWYVRLYAAGDLRYQGRFIVEKRMFGSGVAAVAPYDTTGYVSPDWTAFQWTEEDTTPKSYPGLPGSWVGNPYNFVRGGQGVRPQGLPPQVVGCLTGT